MSQLYENVLPSEVVKCHFIDNGLSKYFLDLEDHINNLQEKTIGLLDEVNTIISLYSNSLSNKMNDIMKTLTIFSAIFIPLSFLASVFGMNFINFGILGNPYGLLIFVIISLFLVGGMLFYFNKKKWF